MYIYIYRERERDVFIICLYYIIQDIVVYCRLSTLYSCSDKHATTNNDDITINDDNDTYTTTTTTTNNDNSNHSNNPSGLAEEAH